MEPCVDDFPNGAGAWALLTALSARFRSRDAELIGQNFRLSSLGQLEETPPGQAWVCIDAAGQARCGALAQREPSVARMLDLYLPLCSAKERTVGHVGQSLDGQIATESGASRFVTGPENILHLHRLRALSDAVIVGASTVERDDPQLTTRLVPGPSPVRVVIDPKLRLPATCRLYRDEGPRTLVVCARGRAAGQTLGTAELVEVPPGHADEVLPPRAIVRALRERGLQRLFIEGGGVTISRFLEAGALDRLHVAIGPLFIGKGRPGISLPPIQRLEQALRPRTRRFDLGDDVLFDCDLEGG
jgi:riboflavin-specific deaminase-like protein